MIKNTEKYSYNQGKSQLNYSVSTSRDGDSMCQWVIVPIMDRSGVVAVFIVICSSKRDIKMKRAVGGISGA